MFSLIHRVIKTRDGKIYSGEPEDFQDQGSVVIYKGFLNVFKHNIHTENIFLTLHLSLNLIAIHLSGFAAISCIRFIQ